MNIRIRFDISMKYVTHRLLKFKMGHENQGDSIKLFPSCRFSLYFSSLPKRETAKLSNVRGGRLELATQGGWLIRGKRRVQVAMHITGGPPPFLAKRAPPSQQLNLFSHTVQHIARHTQCNWLKCGLHWDVEVVQVVCNSSPTYH